MHLDISVFLRSIDLYTHATSICLKGRCAHEEQSSMENTLERQLRKDNRGSHKRMIIN